MAPTQTNVSKVTRESFSLCNCNLISGILVHVQPSSISIAAISVSFLQTVIDIPAGAAAVFHSIEVSVLLQVLLLKEEERRLEN